MRLILMHKNDPHTEAGERPPMELVARMGDFIGEHIAKGQFLDGNGLGRSATRTRLTFREGRAHVKHGPYAGGNELPHAVLLLKVRTRDEAIGWAERYGKILGDGEIELGPVTEPWDLGFGPKPDDAPLRVLLLEKADAASEAGQRSSKQKGELTRLRTEMTKAGVLLASEQLAPSSASKRLVFKNHEMKVHDGPFSESKELIGGYSIMRLPSMEVAIAECQRYAEILGGTLECDLRPLDEPSSAAIVD